MKEKIDFSDIPKGSKSSELALKNLGQMVGIMKQHDTILRHMSNDGMMDKMIECLSATSEIIKTEKASNTELLTAAFDRMEKANEKFMSSIMTKVDSNIKAITGLSKELSKQLSSTKGLMAESEKNIKVDAQIKPDKTKKKFEVDVIRNNTTDLSEKLIIEQVK